MKMQPTVSEQIAKLKAHLEQLRAQRLHALELKDDQEITRLEHKLFRVQREVRRLEVEV